MVERPNPVSARVLLAEDNPVNQKVAVAMLRKLGVAVDTAANGREALECGARNRYDLPLMDCEMPEMDGFDATRELRRLYPQRRLRIVALTGNCMDSDRRDCMDAGMDDFLSKPFRARDLEEMLRRWVPGAEP
jgi:CheY-like chemotaxis protein